MIGGLGTEKSGLSLAREKRCVLLLILKGLGRDNTERRAHWGVCRHTVPVVFVEKRAFVFGKAQVALRTLVGPTLICNYGIATFLLLLLGQCVPKPSQFRLRIATGFISCLDRHALNFDSIWMVTGRGSMEVATRKETCLLTSSAHEGCNGL